MIVGIDLGVRKLHISRSDDDALSIAVKPTIRHHELIGLTKELITELPVHTKAYVEEPVVAGVRNLRTSLQMSQLMGALMVVLAEVVPVPVSSWKRGTVGKGNATKDEVAKWLEENHPRSHKAANGSQDLVDAACIRLYGEQMESLKR